MAQWMARWNRTALGLLTTALLGNAALGQEAGTAAQAQPVSGQAVAAGPVSPELMRAIRAATFEVVLKKAEADPLEYEKPLPFDLLPFAERNDAYRSIGTAFAISADTFVTAAHVTSAASGSQQGTPALRDSQGKVYPIDRVTRYSLDRDFIVFTVSGMPRVTPLPASREIQIDTAVIAVGNALGQGIVARDGTLTSETPEEQDGAWKWLRFSAPASPGNSGGPLLDSRGRVIGVIARKSANENLNYALPIALVLDAPANRGSIDQRITVSLPYLTARKTVRFKADFGLPLRFAEFDRRLIALADEHATTSRRELLDEAASGIFPRGNSSRLLADTFLNSNPSVISQQADGSWDVPRSLTGGTTQLGNDGYIWMGAQTGAAMFRIRYPGDLDVAKSRGDSKLLSEQLLRGVTLSRPFGAERVRITSLGDAGKPKEFKDGHGRTWQQWVYPMPYADSNMVVTALPVPEGYVGMWRSSGGGAVDRTAEELRLLADYIQVSYSGSLPQWRAFLANTRLRPESFGKWKAQLDPASPVSIEFPRLAVNVEAQVLPLTDRSVLNVFPGTLMEGDKPVWDVLAVQFNLEPRLSPGMGATRRPQPAADAGQPPNNRWTDMKQSGGQYNGRPIRNQNGGFARGVVGVEGKTLAEATVLYELIYSTTSQVQGEVQRSAARLPYMFRVLEK